MNQDLKRRSSIRLALLLLFLFGGLSYIFSRLVNVQVVQAGDLSAKALKQRLRTFDVPPARGTIFDQNGEELAASHNVETVIATPYLINNKEKLAFRLAPLLGLSEKEVYEKISRDSGFVYLGRKIDKTRTAKIRELIKKEGVDGISFLKDYKRNYPFNELGAQVIGFTGLDNNGLSGLEYYYEKELGGKPGKLTFETQPRGLPIPEGEYEYEKEANGNSLYTSIDKDVQYKAEAELKKAVEDAGALGGTVVVMDPQDGAILAMANYPVFDLNNFNESEKEDWINCGVCMVYEPGSTMKTIIAASAIEDGLVEPETRLYLPSSLKVGDKTIKESHPRPAGSYTVTDIVKESYNVGAVRLGQQLGKEKLYDYLKEFGFGKETEVDFSGEPWGYIPATSDWSATTIANIPFGQGILVTPLQMTRALSAIANGGFLVQPHFVKKIIYPNGKTKAINYKSQERKIISTETSKKMTTILEKVITDGTGSQAAVTGYSVAGKTGTAQKARAKKDGGGYVAGKYTASFMGFVPSNDPRLSIIVVIDEPRGAYYGGVVAAPVFREVAAFALRHLRIPPGTAVPGENKRESIAD